MFQTLLYSTLPSHQCILTYHGELHNTLIPFHSTPLTTPSPLLVSVLSVFEVVSTIHVRIGGTSHVLNEVGASQVLW